MRPDCCSQLFGEEDPDEDVSPDTEDPELTGEKNEKTFGNFLTYFD